MNPINVAILGFGKIAEDQHVPSIAANPRFELAATSSRHGKGPEPQFTDWRELIQGVEGLEAVAITTPPAPRHPRAGSAPPGGLPSVLEPTPAACIASMASSRRIITRPSALR